MFSAAGSDVECAELTKLARDTDLAIEPRWHGPGVGFAAVECKDGKALYEWVEEWADLLEMAVHPVVEDREGAAVLRRIYKGR